MSSVETLICVNFALESLSFQDDINHSCLFFVNEDGGHPSGANYCVQLQLRPPGIAYKQGTLTEGEG